ncbi:MAG TPA: metal ABC transporter ATP-binding protein [Acidimicrobiia bacterium]|jgi:manganese transport system ATP-binding protein|nr:metal ABC transporter ATP-binding protein [Acidimicrobiia bacterium]
MRPAAVRAVDLVLAYGPNIAVGESSFEIPRGGITVLIGPNGSGKSTLLSAMAGLIDPVAGSIDVPREDGSAQRISYVLQSTKVNDTLPVTVREVVTMGRYAGSSRRLDSADHTAVDEALNRMGITQLAGHHLRELSGGQRQRVLVAQGLAQEHEILLLDEPLTGLDLTSAQAIDQVIHDETQTGCTIVMTTHDLAEAEVADHVVLLSGRVVASGTAEEVLTVENLTAAYGPNLLHVEGERLFIDDPAHRPVPGRHDHRDRSG